MKKSKLFIPIILVLLLVACQPAAAVPTAPIPASTLPVGVAPSATPAAMNSTPGADAVIRLSMDQMQEKFDIPADEITITQVTPKTWPDASLGCPKRGVLYIPVVTPGYELLLEARGHVFTYHTDQQSLAVLCSVEPPDEIYLQP